MSRFGNLVMNIIILKNVLNCNFSHVSRMTNGCAHNLARYAFEYGDYSL